MNGLVELAPGSRTRSLLSALVILIPTSDQLFPLISRLVLPRHPVIALLNPNHLNFIIILMIDKTRWNRLVVMLLR